MSLDDDLLADLVAPIDPMDAVDAVDAPDEVIEDGPAPGRTAVSPDAFEQMVARHEALAASAAGLREQLLEARDRLADAEGDLAIAEAKRGALGPAEAGGEVAVEHVAAREDVARKERAVARTGRAVELLEQQLDDVDVDLAAAASALDAVTPVEPEPAEPTANLYDSVYEFVPMFLAKVYAREIGRQINTFRWCSTWWEHAEAVSRLEALWKSFEVLRLDPGTGAAVWWRDFADPTMSMLCSPEGPFKQCSDSQHKLIDDLPTVPAPRAFLEQGSPAESGAPA
jgi:hypothetical protein